MTAVLPVWADKQGLKWVMCMSQQPKLLWHNEICCEDMASIFYAFLCEDCSLPYLVNHKCRHWPQGCSSCWTCGVQSCQNLHSSCCKGAAGAQLPVQPVLFQELLQCCTCLP